MTEVTAKLSGNDREVTVNYDFGEDLDAAVELFGADVVHKAFAAQATVSLQSMIRSGIKGEKSDQEIQKNADEWKPGARKPARSKAEKVLDQFAEMDADAKAALLKELTASVKGK